MSTERRALLVAGVAAAAAAAGGWFAWMRFAPAAADAAAVDLLYMRTLPDDQGRAYALDQLRGRTVVLNFWATWCPPCIDEMPELATLHREIAHRNATVIGIGIDSPSNIREFASKHQFPYPLLVAGLEGTELSRQLGNKAGALPFTVVIDAEGQLINRKLGRIRLEDLRGVVLAALERRRG